jgi:hypothetical protein
MRHGLFSLVAIFVAASCYGAEALDREAPIDREALVRRHNIVLSGFHDKSPLAVGNGSFAFNFDVTGLQTFPSEEPGAVPLATMAEWGWHSFPGSEDVPYEAALREYTVHGRKVSYATDMESDAAKSLRANPHRFNLGRIALGLVGKDGRRATRDDIQSPRQTLDLWTGEVVSEFEFDGEPVTVRTVAHPTLDAVAVTVESPLGAQRQVAIDVSSNYPSGEWGPELDDESKPERRTTGYVFESGSKSVVATCDVDGFDYHISGHIPSNTDAGVVRVLGHRPHSWWVEWQSPKAETVFRFAADSDNFVDPLSYEEVRQASADHWKQFWERGAAIDLSQSTDPRWYELERRIVLSQYLTALHSAGTMPQQETGLVCNSWFGKHHLEMHWWHAAHFALWGRADLLERSLGWYEKILPAARRIAERQGYAGVRWPKMTDPEGVSSPSSVGELLIWQQPHPIWLVKLVYEADPTPETLERYWPIVEATADFMADYAHYDAEGDRYVLGPLLVAAQESYSGLKEPGVLNPTFELAYWRWALGVASEWRERMGLPPNEKWIEVAEKIAKPTVRDGVYAAIETAPYTIREDHPSMLAAFGMLPDVGLVDRKVMDRTLTSVLDDWDWQSTWGWDCPMAAMTAARLGRSEDAVALLLRDTPKNGYLRSGHCWQEDRLPVHLPANGGLLYAVAMMAAGWEGADPSRHAPGFPADGSWVVRWEGLRRAD